MSSSLEFEDLLLFEESKAQSIVSRALMDDSVENKTEFLESFREDLVNQLRSLPVVKEGEISEEQVKIIEQKINDIMDINQVECTNDSVSRFKEIVEEMADTYERKNNDYGDSFSSSIEKYGYVAGLVRLSDKWNRLNSLLLGERDQMVNGESVIDTLTDMACYAIMLRMEIENREK